MKTVRHFAFCLGLSLLASSGLTSCDKYNYTDQLQQLGSRVEILEQRVQEMNTELAALNELIATVEKRGYIANGKKNTDGTTPINFNSGKTYTLRDGHQGVDGKAAELQISVAQDPADGVWYWTLNGTWMLDGEGNRMQAGATDGKNGRNGSSGYVVLPQMRINTETRNWEISTDAGETWTDTGFCADGKDGKNGADGVDDIFMQISVSGDGKSITFILNDGRTFTVPVIIE